ncbi:MAG: transglutaminase domain-containing protein [Clostridia bacterium]|nr:transglutaminase domain-containing protein [Clostridia bacterium]
MSSPKKDSIVNKKQKPKKPDNVYYSPADDMSPAMLYVGLALRTLVLFLGVFGITTFILGAAGLTASDYWQAAVVSPPFVALLSLPVAVACAAASLGKLPAIITPFAYTGIYMAIAAIAFGDPIDFTVKSALRIYNHALYHVSSFGYYSLGNFMVSDGFDYSNASTVLYDPYRFGGAFLLATLIGLILYFCIQKKTRITPIVILMTLVFAPILTYNVAEGNAGISFCIVFICAALALKVYDHRYGGRADRIAEKKKKKEEKKKARADKKAAKKAAKKALIDEANAVFDRAIDADMTPAVARKARKAVFKTHKASKKTAKANSKKQKKLDRIAAKKAKKDKKARLSALSKELSKAKKRKDAQAIEAALAAIKNEKAPDDIAKLEKARSKKEKKQAKKERQRQLSKISRAGGYTGAGVALIAFLAIWLPLAIVSGPFKIIKPINDRVQTARAYVTAYLRGSDVDLNDPYVYGIDDLAPRELTFEPLELDDRLLFRVDADGTSNVYLRSWAATGFDHENGKWYSADYDEVHAYREKFGKDFTPDSIKTDFYSYVYPASTAISEEDTYKNFTKYGFTVQQIDVWRVRGQSLLVFVPAHMNTDQGILKYTELTPTDYKYQNYFEGTYSSFRFRYGVGYSTISYITALNRADTASSIDASLRYYELCRDAILASPDATEEEATAIIYALEEQILAEGLEYQGTSICDRYYFSMTDEEKAELLESFKTEKKYREYVYENYTDKAENEAIKLFADELYAKALESDEDGVLTTHETVNAIVDTFRNDFTYTETPNGELTTGTKPVIEAFLYDVKQGYCTHFATAAVTLLHEYGIPARFVEGYVASDFESLGGYGAKNRADVIGTDAHAWIEVYIDGMGWMQYEVTPGQYCEDMYDPNSDTIDPSLLNPTDEPEEEDGSKPPFGEEPDIDSIVPDDDYEVKEEVSDLEWFLRILLIGLCVAAFGTLIYFIIRYINKRASVAMKARYEVIDTAKNQDAFTDKDTDSRQVTRKITDYILEIYDTIGCGPRPGELQREFAARMKEDYGNLSGIDVMLVIEYMEKEEFGHGLSYSELHAMAEYLEDIIASVYSGLNIWQKIYYRYFKRKI